MIAFSRPYEPGSVRIDDIYLTSIAYAINFAWINVEVSGFTEYENENKVSYKLMEELNILLSNCHIKNFNQEIFETVVRDSKLKDFSGRSFEEMPDLTFRLAGRWPGSKTDVGLFVECKVIDKDRGLDLYVKNGISRYAEGKYAWKMAHGMMVGYVYNNKKLPNDLEEFFKRGLADAAKKYPPIGLIARNENLPSPPEVFRSIHGRQFTLEGGILPGNIELDHLWLYREKENM